MSATIELTRHAARWLVRLEFVFLSLTYLYFVISDQVPALAWVLIAFIWLARWWTTGELLRLTPLDLPILLILLWLPISMWVSTSWWLSQPKAYGVILGVLFFYAVVRAIATRRDLAWATFWLVLVFIAIAVAGLVGTDWAQGKILSASFIYDRLPRFIQAIPRSIAGGFARNGVGGTLALTIPFLASLLWATGGWRMRAEEQGSRGAEASNSTLLILVLVALALSLVAVALTQSRGAILGTAVGLLAIAIWRERRFGWVVVAGAVGLIALILMGQGNALGEFLLRMDAQSGTLASRIEVWQRGVLMVQDFPFTGIGIGTYNNVAHALYPFFIAAPDELVPHAHNNLLQVAVDLGIPGLIAFVALLVGFAVCLARGYRALPDQVVRALIVGLGSGMLAHQTFGLTDAFILGTKPGVLLWVFFALASVVYQMSDE
ncbi:MAG: O-antigen ligase family protein [Chloroflexi bacterium]|nr:O-antigen ligase family protein [Chloroflexota bacterium]